MSRRQSQDAVAAAGLVGAMIVLAGILLAIAIRILAVLAQPLAMVLGTLADGLRNTTHQVWASAVVHPESTTAARLRLARRADAGDPQAMQEVVRIGIEELQGGLSTMSGLLLQIHATVPAEIPPSTVSALRSARANIDDVLRQAREFFGHAGDQLGHLCDATIAFWEHSSSQTGAAHDTLTGLQTEKATIAALVSTAVDRLMRIQNLIDAAFAAVQTGADQAHLLASAHAELVAASALDPWNTPIAYVNDSVQKAAASASASAAPVTSADTAA